MMLINCLKLEIIISLPDCCANSLNNVKLIIEIRTNRVFAELGV